MSALRAHLAKLREQREGLRHVYVIQAGRIRHDETRCEYCSLVDVALAAADLIEWMEKRGYVRELDGWLPNPLASLRAALEPFSAPESPSSGAPSPVVGDQ